MENIFEFKDEPNEELRSGDRSGESTSSDSKLADIFSNIEALRYSDPGGDFSSNEILNYIPVRKPGRRDFVRVNDDPSMTFATNLFVDKEDRDQYYIVGPNMLSMLDDEVRPFLLALSKSRDGVLFFWPIALSTDTSPPNPWHETAREAMEYAKKFWIRVKSDMHLGAYRTMTAQGSIPELVWPSEPLQSLLKKAFGKRVIEDENHPLVRRLRGLS